MRCLETIRVLGFLTLSALACAVAPAGTISLEWDPVPGAAGYRVYYGTESGAYDTMVEAGNVTGYTIDGVDPCVRYYAAVKAYNVAGESAAFSDEVAGGVRPEIHSITPPVMIQGSQLPIEILGAQFNQGAELQLVPDSVPTDVDGNPLVWVDSYSVTGCRRISALLTVEPTVRGLRAMEVGDVTLQLLVVNPDSVFGSDPVALRIALDPQRLDINQSDNETRNRVDGQDLVWLSHAYGFAEGEGQFNPDADIDGDGIVDGQDLAQLATSFGACWTGSGWSEDACR